MKIIEYENKYLEDVKDLLVELEEYIISIDEDELDQLHDDYEPFMRPPFLIINQEILYVIFLVFRLIKI